LTYSIVATTMNLSDLQVNYPPVARLRTGFLYSCAAVDKISTAAEPLV